MSEEKNENRIPNWQDPNWMKLVNEDARKSFGGGSGITCSLPEVRNPGEVNMTPVEEAKIIGEARRNKELTK